MTTISELGQNAFHSKYENELISPTFESPILSTNTSQFSTGSCLDYSLCKETPDSEMNISDLTLAHEERISTPRHLFHENAVNDNSTMDTLINALDVDFGNESVDEVDQAGTTMNSLVSSPMHSPIIPHIHSSMNSTINITMNSTMDMLPNSPPGGPLQKQKLERQQIVGNVSKQTQNSNKFIENDENRNSHLSNYTHTAQMSSGDEDTQKIANTSKSTKAMHYNTTPYKSSPITKFVSIPQKHQLSSPKFASVSEYQASMSTHSDTIPVIPIDPSSPNTNASNNSTTDSIHLNNPEQSYSPTFPNCVGMGLVARRNNSTSSPLLSPVNPISATDLENVSPHEYRLVSYITQLFDQQRRINVMNMKLNCVNLFANFANAVKTNSLIRTCGELSEEVKIQKENCEILSTEVSRGKEKITTMESVLSENQNTIQALNTSVQDLNHSLNEQNEKLEYASAQYRSSLRHMEKSLSQYQKIFDQIERAKLRRDLAFDGGLLISCLYIVNTFIVNFPLKIFTTLIRFQKRSTQKWVHFLMKSLIMMCMYIATRKLAMAYRIHNAVGGIATYFSLVAGGFINALAYRLGFQEVDD